jgi:hypothetical protein
MTINITIPDGSLGRITAAYGSAYGYSTTITNADGTTSTNPETLNAFTKRMVVRQIKEIVLGYEQGTAIQTAQDTAKTAVDTINIT